MNYIRSIINVTTEIYFNFSIHLHDFLYFQRVRSQFTCFEVTSSFIINMNYFLRPLYLSGNKFNLFPKLVVL